jgi:hypothetical protein
MDFLQLRKGTERGAEQKLEGLGCAVVAVIPFTDEDTEDEEEGVFILARKVAIFQLIQS